MSCLTDLDINCSTVVEIDDLSDDLWNVSHTAIYGVPSLTWGIIYVYIYPPGPIFHGRYSTKVILDGFETKNVTG